MLLNVCLRVLPGATLAASKANFVSWLDAVIQGMTKHDTLVYHGTVREPGFYHQILMKEFVVITLVLSQAFGEWGRDCATNALSCGVCYYVAGAEDGSLMITYQAGWGRFWRNGITV